MICPNCGAENEAGARFCSTCGRAMEEGAVRGTVPEAAKYPAQGAKKSGKPVLRIVAIVAVVAVLAVLATVLIPRLIQRNLVPGGEGANPAEGAENITDTVPERIPATPEERFSTALERGLTGLSSSAAGIYDNGLTSGIDLNDLHHEAALDLRLSDSALEMLGGSFNLDLSWIHNIGLDLTSDGSAQGHGAWLGLRLNDKSLAGVDLALDTEEMALYLRASQISDLWMKVALSDLMESMPYEVRQMYETFLTGDTQGIVERYYNALPSAETLERMVTRYYTIIREEFGAVTEDSGTLTAAGVSAECATLSTAVTPEQLERALRNLAAAAAEDEDLKQMLRGMESAAGAEFCDDLMEELRETAEQPDGFTGVTTPLRLTAWLDGEENLRGLWLESEEGTGRLCLSVPRDGDRFGLELSMIGNEMDQRFSGSGTVGERGITGDFSVSEDGEDLLLLTVKELSLAGADRSAGRCDMTVSLTQELWLQSTGDPDLARMLEAFSLEMELNSTDRTYSAELRLMQDGAEFAALALNGSFDAARPVEQPGESVDPETWANSALNEGGLMKFVRSLYDSDIPEEYLNQLVAALLQSAYV